MKYEIANIIVEYEPKYEELRRFSEPFRYDGDRQTDIRLSLPDNEPDATLAKMTGATLGSAESFLYSGSFNRAAIRFRTMLVHSSALVCDGKAYLFTADSGVGKSTHTRLWLREFGDRVHIFNDDKPVVRIGEDGLYACGTPFDGGSGIALNETYPLGAIIFVERALENSVRVPSSEEIIRRLYFQTAHRVGPQTAAKMLDNFDLLIGKARFYVLACNMEPEAAHVAYDNIIGKKQGT